jgi:hypothetical protein
LLKDLRYALRKIHGDRPAHEPLKRLKP